MSKKNGPKNILPPIQLALVTAIAANMINTIAENAQYNAALKETEPAVVDPNKTVSRFHKKAAVQNTRGTLTSATLIPDETDIEDAAESFIEKNCPYLVSDNNPDRRFYITQSINIGRYPHNDIQLSDETVSRVHCRIYVSNGEYYLIDMGAATPSTLNGKTVNNFRPEREQDLFRYKLEDGDRITIGRLTYYFHMPPSAARSSRSFNKGSSTMLID